MKYIGLLILTLFIIGCSSSNNDERPEEDPPCYADGDCLQDGTPIGY